MVATAVVRRRCAATTHVSATIPKNSSRRKSKSGADHMCSKAPTTSNAKEHIIFPMLISDYKVIKFL